MLNVDKSNLCYASLHNHSDFSNLKLIDSINKVNLLIDYGYELGLKGIAITDHDCLSGHIRALEYFENNYSDKDYKLVLGNEIYITREGLNSTTHTTGEKFYHCILLAKDKIGYEQIVKLSSRAWDRSYIKAITRTPTYLSDIDEIIGSNPGHVICTTACLGGISGSYFITYGESAKPKIDNFLSKMRDLFNEDFYIELQPSKMSDQINYNNFMINNYWNDYQFIVATDSHYLKESERELHKQYLKSKDGSGNREVDSFYSSAYMMGSLELFDMLFEQGITKEYIYKLFNNTLAILNKCDTYSLKRQQIVPKIKYEWGRFDISVYKKFETMIPKDTKYDALHYYFSDNAIEDDRYFANLISNGYDKLFKDTYNIQYFDRLEEELSTILAISNSMQQSLGNYFTTMSKIIDIIWENGDSLIGVGRGSGVGSLINYLLGITQVDPLTQELQLPFWRFMHKSRPGLPDIDFDTESGKRKRIFTAVENYFKSIGSDAINICTFGTLGTKSAIRTAGKGLGIEDADVNYIVSLIPTVRGTDWTLEQCMFGDEEHPAIKQFEIQMKTYPLLWSLSQRIAGLVTHLGVHASGVLIINGKVTDYNSIMKTNSGIRVTAWDLDDSEITGALKYDFLTIQALDKIRTCMNLLIEDGRMEWQGDLRSTYNKYLLPKNLQVDLPEMWKKMSNGEIIECFQYDTIVGGKAARLIKPTNIKDLASGNSVMRLMVDKDSDIKEQPLDTFVRYKNNINEWFDEMDRANLTNEDQDILKKYLLPVYGVAASQELAMQLTMDAQIARFSVAEANKLRKGIAKKKPKTIQETKELFFTKGIASGTRQELLDYVWNVQIARQIGYSFSDLHTLAYSIIALQEMNLAYLYPDIYWNCACLSVNADAINDEDYENLVESGVIIIEEDEESKKVSKVNYGKIASAIAKFKNTINIEMPDINKAKMGFFPNVPMNSILFGMKGLNRIGDDLIANIIERRPFLSLEDFLKRMRDGNRTLISKDKVINLIKSGCFDKIENSSRYDIMEKYIRMLVDKHTNLNLNNFLMLIRADLVPEELKLEKGIFLFTKEARTNSDDNGFYKLSDIMYQWYVKYLGKEPLKLDSEWKVNSASWESYYQTSMNKVRTWIKKDMAQLMDSLYTLDYNAEWNKYASGDILQWELDSINFYHSGHPFANIQIPVPYESINDLIENDFDGYWTIKDKQIPRINVKSIVGTIIFKDKKSNIVYLSTPDGVLKVKIYKSQFARLDKITKDCNGDIIEDSYLSKGNHLMITGYLRDEMFIPKVYKDSLYEAVVKIELSEDNKFIKFINKQG